MDEFDRALEAIFEDRASQFSDDLRHLLKQLWREGIKEGRAQEREASPPPFVVQEPSKKLFQNVWEQPIQSEWAPTPTERVKREMLGTFDQLLGKKRTEGG